MDHLKHYGKLLRDSYKHRFLGKSATDPKVMVIADARALYLPVPKAANSSARRALAPSVRIPIETVGDVHKDTRLPIRNWSEMEAEIASGWYLFTITRNPFTRVFSAYHDKVVRMGVQLRSLRAMGLQPGDSFDTFLAACVRWPRRMLNDHFIPQADLLWQPLETGRLDVVKSEDLPGAWTPVADRIEAAGAPRPAPIEHTNRSGAQERRHEFTPRQIALIRRLYAEDFARFGYPGSPP